MDYDAVFEQVIALLQQHKRLSDRVLKLRLQLDDDTLEALKEDLIYAKHLAMDEDGKVLVWVGEAASQADQTPKVAPEPPEPRAPEAERRQLTVLFCDLVDSTVLASQLDPEEWREVVRAYQDTCAKVIACFEGHIAQYLGDGLLVYFGYPLAHEDDAQRAVRAGLGMMEALGQLNTRLGQERAVRLAVRLGCHTGLVVGEVGGGARQEQLALGETPNLAARLQGIAAPNTLVISAATFQLLGGFFACQPLGTPPLKGLTQPLVVYRVLYESMARSRLEAAGSTGWTPLVGREQEVALLRERWAQVKEGLGQVVLLSGEAGIGKSRLVQVLKAQVATESQAWLTPCQCLPYYQNTALYPLIDLLERVVLHFDRDESPQQKLRKLEGHLVQYGFPLAEAVPLYASLLSLPLTADYPPLHLAPEQHKQQTLQTLLTTLLRMAAQQPVLFVMEDRHWVDPTTLEFLSLLVNQGPTARILALLTFRPDFSSPWTGRSHLTQVTLPRLPRHQAEEMAAWVAHRKMLPAEVMEQVVAKTDGVPLFVEELTKMVLESGLLQEREERYELTGPLPPLAIPTTLHDSLMARLDRLATVKGLSQLGATLGREFSYELLHAVSPWDEATLQRGLHQLVEVEFLYQQGLPPQATYRFKHALIQDAAYQALLKSTRQQYHQRIAQVLVERFLEIVETQPELLAHHYTEASVAAEATPYWLRAGQRAIQRSANLEAIGHLTTGIAGLKPLPETRERTQQELDLQMTLALALTAIKGHAAQEMEEAYARAHELCQKLGNPPQVFPVLFGLWRFYNVRAAFKTSYALAHQCLSLAQQQQDPAHLPVAHYVVGHTLFWQGEFTSARAHLKQALTLDDPEQHRSLTVHYLTSPRVQSLFFMAWTLWMLGYPDQALQRNHEALTMAYELAQPFSLAFALCFAACVLQACRDVQAVQERAEAAIMLTKEQAFSHWFAHATIMQGWAQATQGHGDAGMVQMGRGLTAYQGTGARLLVPYVRALMAEVYGHLGQEDVGLTMLAEAMAVVENTGGSFYKAELHRLQGDLLLSQSASNSIEAEARLQQALEVARRQEAKSLELRAAMSLSRLWQQQGKRDEARELLAPIYGWFTEGFDTADLQEGKALIEALASS